MTLDELSKLLSEATWFNNLGRYTEHEGTVPLSDLAPWSGTEYNASEESVRVANAMDWLPSSRDQGDPIHGDSLDHQIISSGLQAIAQTNVASVYRLTLTSLQKTSVCPLLVVGPHDFTEAAKGAALYAARRAVIEIMIGKPDFWCGLIRIYAQGNWPCGIMPNGTVVVF